MKTITSGEQVNEYVNYPTPSPLSTFSEWNIRIYGAAMKKAVELTVRFNGSLASAAMKANPIYGDDHLALKSSIEKASLLDYYLSGTLFLFIVYS
jgi:hypothetical protein